MDPVESFIQSKQKFSLSLLINAHSRLSVIQLQKGCVTQEDTQQSLRSPVQQLTGAEITAHAGLLFESIITPSISATGQVKLQVNKDIVGNDDAFIGAILGVVQTKCAGVEYPLVEEFRREALTYLRSLSEPLKAIEPAAFDSFSGLATEFLPERPNVPKHVQAKAPSPVLQAAPLPPPPQLQQLQQPQQQHQQAQLQQQTAPSATVEYDGPEEHKYAPARLEFERAEPIVRLLAQLRKVGMDILFPQSTHDKILAIIFVAVKSFATPAHRELIDMVMAVKDSGKVATQLEPVSKTKIRGVLALLKHGELLVTQGDYGEPVRLYLAPGIETFKDLRERHDSFLSSYMLDHHLFIPAMLRTELVWQLDEETRLMRLDAMDKLVNKLKYFFGSLAEYSANAIPADSDTISALTTDPSTAAGAAANKAQQGQGQGQGFQQGYGGRGGRAGVGAPQGRGGMPGRGYPAYGGGAPTGGRGGGRYGPYGQYGGHFNGNFDGGYYGGGYGGGGGRYSSYANSRAQHQRMANAQASLNWANNEDYAELANDDWNESGSAKSSTARSGAAAAVAVAPLGSGSVSLPMQDSGGLKSQLSPQAPSFDPTKIKGGNVQKQNSPSQGVDLDVGVGRGMLNFDYGGLNSSGSAGTSRLDGLAARMQSHSMSAHNDDSAWLAAAATGRNINNAAPNFDIWNAAGSSFFNNVADAGMSTELEPPLGRSTVLQGSDDLGMSLSALNLGSRPYQSAGNVGAMTPPLDLGLSLSLGVGDALGGGSNTNTTTSGGDSAVV